MQKSVRVQILAQALLPVTMTAPINSKPLLVILPSLAQIAHWLPQSKLAMVQQLAQVGHYAHDVADNSLAFRRSNNHEDYQRPQKMKK